jgi:hypothetical protein
MADRTSCFWLDLLKATVAITVKASIICSLQRISNYQKMSIVALQKGGRSDDNGY